MAYININRSLNDMYYRYKMPKLIAKVEGKGNGIKTVIVNMSEIAKALSRPPTYPTKYFGCELGSQTQFDAKKDRYIVNGQHDANKLQDILDGFIRKYVLCGECENPETVLTVLQRRNIINTKCLACGYSGQLETNHKLNTFILKNPPEGSNVKAKDVKTPKKDKKKKDDNSPNNSAEENDIGDKKNGDTLNEADFRDDLDDDWAEDTPEEAQRRLQNLSVGAKALMLDADSDKPEHVRINLFYEFVKQSKLETAAEYKAIYAEAYRLDILDKAPMVLCEVILNVDAVKLIKTHAKLFLLFTDGKKRAQRYLLGGIEQIIKLHKDVLLGKTLAIFKTLYDEDIVEEEQLIEWSKKVSKRFVGKEFAQLIHNAAKPFITWLQNATEESDEEESAEDAVEIEYDDRHSADGLREVKETTPKPNGNSITNGKAASPEDDDDDLDIDEI